MDGEEAGRSLGGELQFRRREAVLEAPLQVEKSSLDRLAILTLIGIPRRRTGCRLRLY